MSHRAAQAQIDDSRAMQQLGKTECTEAVASELQPARVGLLLSVLGALDRQAVSYCYWKSSRRVEVVLAGNADMDLLIAREHQHRAEQVLLECGFKLFPSVAAQDHPAILSFLGFDEPSGRLLHLHVHFRLVVGERLLKNYRLPWEAALLARAIPHLSSPLRILDPASEAVLSVVRACLELRRLDPVVLRIWRAKKQQFALDRAGLAARLDRAMVRTRAAELLGDRIADAVAEFLYGLDAPQDQGRFCRRLRRELAAHRTCNAIEGRLCAAGRALSWAAGRLNKRFLHAPRAWNRRAPGGGIIVAVLGVDGSGKSTLVAAIHKWLGAEVDTLPVYFGTGDGRPSLFLVPFKLCVPLVTRVFSTKSPRPWHGNISKQAPRALYNLLLMVWATAVALEKRTKLRSAHRGANRGLVVLTDRYPQNEIAGFNDGPLLSHLSRVPLWVRRFETEIYGLARRMPPDLLIKLEVTPETAAQREPDMDPSLVRERIGAVGRLTFPGARVVHVDATQPLNDVIRAAKREIWCSL